MWAKHTPSKSSPTKAKKSPSTPKGPRCFCRPNQYKNIQRLFKEAGIWFGKFDNPDASADTDLSGERLPPYNEIREQYQSISRNNHAPVRFKQTGPASKQGFCAYCYSTGGTATDRPQTVELLRFGGLPELERAAQQEKFTPFSIKGDNKSVWIYKFDANYTVYFSILKPETTAAGEKFTFFKNGGGHTEAYAINVPAGSSDDNDDEDEILAELFDEPHPPKNTANNTENGGRFHVPTMISMQTQAPAQPDAPGSSPFRAPTASGEPSRDTPHARSSGNTSIGARISPTSRFTKQMPAEGQRSLHTSPSSRERGASSFNRAHSSSSEVGGPVMTSPVAPQRPQEGRGSDRENHSVERTGDTSKRRRTADAPEQESSSKRLRRALTIETDHDRLAEGPASTHSDDSTFVPPDTPCPVQLARSPTLGHEPEGAPAASTTPRPPSTLVNKDLVLQLSIGDGPGPAFFLAIKNCASVQVLFDKVAAKIADSTPVGQRAAMVKLLFGPAVSDRVTEVALEPGDAVTFRGVVGLLSNAPVWESDPDAMLNIEARVYLG
ncbi:hypothetical protein BDY21DRAFT_16906 [Lineolata rhizophorae]|uniref:Uncharacterized protein n=1 Tax=Lineolata rhizophorae TaxID=578093 RepID=A0A6A6P191_9PEZI|nr:hypothetical protein BDY21DRAFT_16906 [Lineolata rhizophorae]